MNRIIGAVGGALLASIVGAGVALADNHNGDGGALAVGGVFLLLAAVVGTILYFVPSIIGFKRGHQNAVAIFALNLLAGWTFIGWVGSFVWSLTEVRKG